MTATDTIGKQLHLFTIILNQCMHASPRQYTYVPLMTSYYWSYSFNYILKRKHN